MSRLYLYGMTRPREVPQRLADQGVFLVDREHRAAVVSELGHVDNGGPVEATRRNLLAHADVVEQLHQEAVVLPARFGYVLESREEALELLELPEIDQLLNRHERHLRAHARGERTRRRCSPRSEPGSSRFATPTGPRRPSRPASRSARL